MSPFHANRETHLSNVLFCFVSFRALRKWRTTRVGETGGLRTDDIRDADRCSPWALPSTPHRTFSAADQLLQQSWLETLQVSSDAPLCQCFLSPTYNVRRSGARQAKAGQKRKTRPLMFMHKKYCKRNETRWRHNGWPICRLCLCPRLNRRSN